MPLAANRIWAVSRLLGPWPEANYRRRGGKIEPEPLVACTRLGRRWIDAGFSGKTNAHALFVERQLQRASARSTASTNLAGWSACTQCPAPAMTSTSIAGNIGAKAEASPLGT